MSGSTRTLFITPAYLLENTTIDNNVEQKVLNKCIRTAEDKYIMPLIGSSLYDALITKIQGNTLTGIYKTLMDSFIIPCLLEYSLYEHIPNTSVKFKNKGIQKQSSENSEAASLPDLTYLRENVKDSAQFYGERLIKYLRANQSSLPEFGNINDESDMPPAKGDYFSGIQFPGMNRGGYNAPGPNPDNSIQL